MDWDARLPIFLLAYTASTHDTTGLTPASVRKRTALRPAVLGTPQQGRPTIDHAANLVDHLHDIHNYAHQHLKLASDQMNTRHNRLANCAGYHKGNKAWLYFPTRTKGYLLQSSWEGPYKVVTWINVVYSIQRNPGSRLVVVHLDWLAPYQGIARMSVLKEGAVGE